MSYYQKECPNCKNLIGINVAKCSHCGEVLGNTTSQPFALESLDTISIEETESGQSHLAYRLAAIVLFVTAFLNILNILYGFMVTGAPDIPRIVSLLIDIGLGVGLLQLRPGARIWVLFRVILGGIVFLCIALNNNDVLTAFVLGLIQLSFSGSLILLLTGTSKPWRLIAAGALFVIFTLAPSILLLFLSTLMMALQ